MLTFDTVQKMNLTLTLFKISLIVFWDNSFDHKFLIIMASHSFRNTTTVAVASSWADDMDDDDHGGYRSSRKELKVATH